MLAVVKDMKINDKGVTVTFSEVDANDELLVKLRSKVGEMVEINVEFDEVEQEMFSVKPEISQ